MAGISRRVRNSIHKLQQQDSKGQRIAFFTSGGFIGCAAQFALAAPGSRRARVTLAVAQRLPD